MLSLYIHIPFCEKKCNYCSFQVCPKDLTKEEVWEELLDTYVASLETEIRNYAKMLGKHEIFTIFFGGGTPGLLGPDRIIRIIHLLEDVFELSNLSELTIELNPYPTDTISLFVSQIQQAFKGYSRIRFSFGVQSLDNAILTKNQRKCSFTGLVEFLRGLRRLKYDTTVFNLDFIAFGEFNTTFAGEMMLWNKKAWDFYCDLIESHFIDSFSVYTLELFPGSLTFHEEQQKLKEGNQEEVVKEKDELIYDEFSLLKEQLYFGGYQRYELSNFALPGKSSIHNRVYWEMENYLALGTSASGFVNKKFIDTLSSEQQSKFFQYLDVKEEEIGKLQGVRWTNTLNLQSYSQGKTVALYEVLDARGYLIDEFFLAMRTSLGVRDLSKYHEVLVDNYDVILQQLDEQGFVVYGEDALKLTDQGMDVYNTIITDILDL